MALVVNRSTNHCQGPIYTECCVVPTGHQERNLEVSLCMGLLSRQDARPPLGRLESVQWDGVGDSTTRISMCFTKPRARGNVNGSRTEYCLHGTVEQDDISLCQGLPVEVERWSDLPIWILTDFIHLSGIDHTWAP